MLKAISGIVANILQPHFEANRILSYRILELAEEVEKLKAETDTLRSQLKQVEELISNLKR